MSDRIQGAIELISLDSTPATSLTALDLSAGDGRSTRLLRDLGCRVFATEFKPSTPGWVAADLRGSFPFRAASFDLVLMLEVIEHLPDIAHAFGEIARLLKPDGIAIISTPNRLNVTSRIHYLLSGFYKGRRAPLPYRYGVNDGRNWHVMGLNDLHWIAHSNGLHLEALGRSRRKFRALLYAPFLYFPIRLFSFFLYGHNATDVEESRLNRELYRFMTSASLLMDENLIMRFRKLS
jgi:SAM-dependent methyltransferase